MKRLFIFCVIILLVFACKKTNQAPPQRVASSYTFTGNWTEDSQYYATAHHWYYYPAIYDTLMFNGSSGTAEGIPFTWVTIGDTISMTCTINHAISNYWYSITANNMVLKQSTSTLYFHKL